jgi:hypothetical protein
VIDYRYRVQVGDEYATCESGMELDTIVRSLLCETDARSLVSRALGKPEPAPPKRAKMADIFITLEEAPPPPEEPKWTKVGS